MSLVASLAKAPAGTVIDFVTLLSVTIPSTRAPMIGILMPFRGKDLDKDETFQKLIADPSQVCVRRATTLLGQ